MTIALILVLAAAIIGFRLWRRHRGRAAGPSSRGDPRWSVTGDVALVASREVRERVRGKMFRVGTLLILAVVAGAIVIPTLSSSKVGSQRVGVVGPLPFPLRTAIAQSASGVDSIAYFFEQRDRATADQALRHGHVDVVIVDGRQLVVDKPISSGDASTGARFVRSVAQDLGAIEAFQAAHLSAAQSSELSGAKPLPISSVQPGTHFGAAQATSVVGLILIFIMLTQYNTWILMGVMEEKSSRVIEVLLAAVRPMQLLAGKVLGIGLVAFAQAAVTVAFALVVAEVVGSNLLHGTAPVVLVATLVWLVLGYAFYCWVYAAAGSMVERQDQIQSLALPLSLPIIFGYIFALTTASSGSASAFFTVLAYLPPTAPFAMPVLVGFGTVTWWEFAASAAISIVSTVLVARLAAGIYRRAILRTGGRVKFREVLAKPPPMSTRGA